MFRTHVKLITPKFIVKSVAYKMKLFFKLFYEFQSSEVISVCCLLSLDLQPIERLQPILNCGLLLDRISLEPSTNRKASTWLYENYELSD